MIEFRKNENQCNYKGQSEPRKILQQTNENSKWKQANSLKGGGGWEGKHENRDLFYDGNWSEWGTIKSEIVHVIWNHKYDCRLKLYDTKLN